MCRRRRGSAAAAAGFGTLPGMFRARRSIAVAAVLLLSCRQSPAERLARPPELEVPGQGKCNVGQSVSHPLVVEWPAAERASLEARLARGMVAVRAQGCEIEVMRQCEVRGGYSYMGLTRKNDRVKIRNADELYAQLPLGAARLEAKLARKGELDVEIALVGMLMSPVGKPGRDALAGDCEAATHVITGVQVGAFHFFAGGAGEIKAGAGYGQIGAGAGSTAERETLSADGEPARCDAATTADTRPPEGCGALIRIELTPLSAAVATRPTPCPVGGRWDGQRCVMEPCPVGMFRGPDGTCSRAWAGDELVKTTEPARPAEPVKPAPARPAAPVSDEAALCRQACERELACESEASGMAEPEGQGRENYLGRCGKLCEFVVNDYNRGQLRKCVKLDACEAFTNCMHPPDESFDAL